MWRHEVTLIYTTKAKDADGFVVETEIEQEVFANKKSVGRTEYYKAMEIGMEPECIFEMWEDDYRMTEHLIGTKKQYATHLRHEGQLYTIGRTYEESDGKLEVTCYG